MAFGSGAQQKNEKVSWLALMRELARVSEAVEKELTDQIPQEALTRRLLFFLYELDEAIRSSEVTQPGPGSIIDIFQSGLRFSVFDAKGHADMEQVSRSHSVGYALKKRIIHPSLAAMVLVLIAERLRANAPDATQEVPSVCLTQGSPVGSVQFQSGDQTMYCLTDQGLKFAAKEEWQKWCKDERGLPILGWKGALSNYFYSWLNALDLISHGEERIERSKCILWQELILLNPQSTSLWHNLAQAQFASQQRSSARQSLLRFISFHGTKDVSFALLQALQITEAQAPSSEPRIEPASP